jgi:aminoethylphosphonate catabolism LysR family transcriptional regulator
MNFAQLRAFHAVAQHGTFSAAAAALGVSQPAITQHVRALEEAIGGRLFHRRGSGVELTADGHDQLPRVRQIVKALEDINARVDGGRALRTGHLSLGICAPHVAMPVIGQFRALHPGVAIEARISNSMHLLELVADQRVDLAIATLTEPPEELVCHQLVRQELLVAVPADHAWAKRKSVDVKELAGASFVMREHGSMTRQIFEAALGEAGVAIDIDLVLTGREAIKEAVANGLGISIVLDRELGRDPRIVGLRLDGASVEASECIVVHPEISGLGAIREFIALATTHYARKVPQPA